MSNGVTLKSDTVPLIRTGIPDGGRGTISCFLEHEMKTVSKDRKTRKRRIQQGLKIKLQISHNIVLICLVKSIRKTDT
jgi:hypothetical protein